MNDEGRDSRSVGRIVAGEAWTTLYSGASMHKYTMVVKELGKSVSFTDL